MELLHSVVGSVLDARAVARKRWLCQDDAGWRNLDMWRQAMTPDQLITLRLPANYVGQIVDGLDVLIEQWDATERYHENGEVDRLHSRMH